MTDARRAAIAVPVRDEAERLPRLLAALATQQADFVALRLCVALDGCTDASAAVLRDAPLPFPVDAIELPYAAASAGRARRAACALALEQLGDSDVLLTTDADSVPAPDWVTRNLAALELADLVAGRIVRERADPDQDRVERYLARLHGLRRRLDPVAWDDTPGHPFTSGASLAMRAGIYRRLGGFPEHASGEDAALVDAAEAHGLRVRHDAGVVVTTSSRRVGRAPQGLATHLRQLDRCGIADERVAHPADEAQRFLAQAAARATGTMPPLPAPRLVTLAEAERALALLDQPDEIAA